MDLAVAVDALQQLLGGLVLLALKTGNKMIRERSFESPRDGVEAAARVGLPQTWTSRGRRATPLDGVVPYL